MKTLASAEEGCSNRALDALPRINNTWSDTNPNEDRHYSNGIPTELIRLKCTCGGLSFEVSQIPDEYETLARCTICSKYYIVHSG